MRYKGESGLVRTDCSVTFRVSVAAGSKIDEVSGAREGGRERFCCIILCFLHLPFF